MKAIVLKALDGPEWSLVLDDVRDPSATAGTVVVKLHAAGVNHVDSLIREGTVPGVVVGESHVLGVEGAGEVAEVGPGVANWAPGDRVLIDPMLVCGICAACNAGQSNRCGELRVLGEDTPGTYAEYVAVPSGNLIQLPDHVGYVEAAAVFVAFLTAWHMLRSRARLAERETLLVVGAGGGVGSASVQVARLTGARVIATTGTSAKMARLKKLGVHEVINYRETKDFDGMVNELTHGVGVDVAHDSVGAATFGMTLKCLRIGGRLVGMGSHSGSVTRLDLWRVYRNQLQILGAHLGERQESSQWLPLVWGGHMVPVIDSTFPLAEAAQAHLRLRDPERFGKVILEFG